MKYAFIFNAEETCLVCLISLIIIGDHNAEKHVTDDAIAAQQEQKLVCPEYSSLSIRKFTEFNIPG